MNNNNNNKIGFCCYQNRICENLCVTAVHFVYILIVLLYPVFAFPMGKEVR